MSARQSRVLRGFVFAFSHGAAEREFRKAAELDPKLAMAWWGVALVNGPHINFPLVPPGKAKAAWEALGKAKTRAPGAGKTERSLIGALGKRYADPQPGDRRPLSEAYAAKLRETWKAHPEDADVATLFAESAMDLRPWDLWRKDGSPQPGTTEILATLEEALRLDPSHPGANHFFTHVVEASPHPSRGIAAANPNPGLYAMDMAHNDHFFAYVAMMRGRSGDALGAARRMVAAVPDDFIRNYTGIADGHLVFVPEGLMRFGKWEEILAAPEPAANLLDGEMAAKRDRFDEAVRHLREAVRIEHDLVYDEPPDWIQPARHTLGAVLLRAGRPAEAEAVYRQDVVRSPENGWALYGLGRALRLQKKDSEAADAEARFRRQWAHADVTLDSTSFCQPDV